MDEETLNQNLLPLFNIEEDAFLAYDNPVSEDERFAFEKLRSMVAGGIMTANEARMREGLEPVEDPMADALLVNGQPLGGPAPAAPLGMASSAPDGLTGPLDASNEIEEPPMLPTQPEQKDALSDCVSEKIQKLIAEGYPQDQAVAIAYSMCAEGKTLDEIETKAIGDIDTRPPQSVADNARRALEVRARKPESERGMTAVGIARARDLMNRVRLSEDTIRRMAAYFERHEVDKQGSTWDEQGRGWQAWYGWGGDDGFAWAKRKIEEFDRERERNSDRKKKCACGCRCGSISAAEMERKDCGTGEGGFQEGNTCGDEDGGGDGDESSSSSSLASSSLESALFNDEGQLRTSERVRDSLLKLVGDSSFDSMIVPSIDVSDQSFNATETISKSTSDFEKKFSEVVRQSIEDGDEDANIVRDVMMKTIRKAASGIGISAIEVETGDVVSDVSVSLQVVSSASFAQDMMRSNPPEVRFASSTRSNSQLDSVGALASYTDGEIVFHSDLVKDRKALSSAIIHEMTHHADQGRTDPEPLSESQKEIAFKNGFSEYGASVSTEFAAAFNEKLAAGEKLDSDAWELYRSLDGPEHSEKLIDARKK
jgi:hypothetical protein